MRNNLYMTYFNFYVLANRYLRLKWKHSKFFYFDCFLYFGIPLIIYEAVTSFKMLGPTLGRLAIICFYLSNFIFFSKSHKIFKFYLKLNFKIFRKLKNFTWINILFPYLWEYSVFFLLLLLINIFFPFITLTTGWDDWQQST